MDKIMLPICVIFTTLDSTLAKFYYDRYTTKLKEYELQSDSYWPIHYNKIKCDDIKLTINLDTCTDLEQLSNNTIALQHVHAMKVLTDRGFTIDYTDTNCIYIKATDNTNVCGHRN